MGSLHEEQYDSKSIVRSSYPIDILVFSSNVLIFRFSPTEPPKIAAFQFPEELEVGGSTQATCSLVSGDKPIQFTWHKDNLPIPSMLKVSRGLLFMLTDFKENSSNHERKAVLKAIHGKDPLRSNLPEKLMNDKIFCS